jgi:hypothetical protein
MSNINNTIVRFLQELHSKEIQETFETLTVLLDHLENKEDPDPTELKIVELTYQTLEKLKYLDELLRKKVGKIPDFPGTRLQELYDRAEETFTLFD